MLLKIFGCLLIFSGCGGIGFGMGRDYNARISQLEPVSYTHLITNLVFLK